MTAHLPECRKPAHFKAGCICDRLRAAEARVRESMRAYLLADDDNVYAHGYRDALSAARDSVVALAPIDQRVDDEGFVSLVYDKGEVIAAIDALREAT